MQYTRYTQNAFVAAESAALEYTVNDVLKFYSKNHHKRTDILTENGCIYARYRHEEEDKRSLVLNHAINQAIIIIIKRVNSSCHVILLLVFTTEEAM